MQVRWVQVDTHEFWKQTSEAMKSPEAAHEWLARFRETLLMSADNESPLPYAESLVIEAQGYIGIKSVARIRGYVKKNSPDMTDEEIDDFCAKKYGTKYKNAVEAIKNRKAIIEEKNENKTKSKSLSAVASTREDSLNITDGSNSGMMESGTSVDTKHTEPAKNSYGEFSNVKMTTAEFDKLVQAEGAERANALIEELSSYLASSGKRYKSHYATLLNWGRRKDKEGEPKQKFLTADDISRRNYEESKKQLAQILGRASNG